MKKILLLLLTLFVTTAAMAGTLINGIIYDLNSSEQTACVIGKSSDNTGSVTIPSMVIYKGIQYSVTSIGENAFCDCSELTSITIPTSVTSIESGAFYGCTSLTSIDIPNSVTSIRHSAFRDCSSLTKVNISDIGAWCRILFSNGSSNPLYNAHNLYLNNEKIEDLVIPNGVTSIGDLAFVGCRSLTSVTIPNSVTSIGSSAFGNCSGLTSVNISDIAVWCSISFFDCRSNPLFYAHNLYLNNEKIENLVIPDSVSSIRDYAFYGCSGLTSVSIGNSVTNIGDEAFINCSGLTSVTIGNSVTSIGNKAFQYCDALSDVFNFSYMPQQINSNVFSTYGTLHVQPGCESAYKVADVWKNFTIVEDVCREKLLFTINSDGTATVKGVRNKTSNLGDIVIPSMITVLDNSYNVTSIGESAFYDCVTLTSIIIPNSVTSIGESAFLGCYGLTSIIVASGNTKYDSRDNCNAIIETSSNTLIAGCKNTVIPNSVTSIGNRAFYKCYGLTSSYIPNSVTSIGTYAFYDCKNLKEVTINSNSIVSENYYSLNSIFGNQVNKYVLGDSVTSIGAYVFSSCSGLTSITIPNNVTSIGTYAFYDCKNLREVTINSNSIVSENYYSLNSIFGNQVNKYVLGDSVTSIGANAFRDCSGLTSIDIPNSVTSIGNRAFYGCSGLTSIDIPNSVTSIGDSAFYQCVHLSSIVIPPSLASIGYDAFRGCTGLTKVNISDIAAWCRINFSNALSNPLYFAHNLYFNNEKIVNLVIPNDVSIIRFATFFGCSCLTSVTIPNSVMSINKSAFAQCSGIKSVTIGNSVTSIGNYAFYECSSLPSITIPNSVTSIGDFAFQNCSDLTTIDIPNGVTSIGESAFCDCTNLKTVTINSDSIMSRDYSQNSSLKYIFGNQVKKYVIGENVTSIGAYAFDDCSGLTSIDIPNSVTNIGDGAFSNCTGLTSVNIPNSVTNIGDGAFSSCTGLTSVNIPNSVKSIGSHAFYGCKSLTSITIPNSVTSIGIYVFYGCTHLTSVTIGNSVTSIGNYAFCGCSGLTSITIGNSVTSIGNYAFQSCTHLTSIDIPDGVTSIGNHAFKSCSGLTSVTIGNSVTSIGGYAFGGCSGLTSIDIPNSVTNIGDEAFRNCSGLTSVTIGNSVTSIGSSAFRNCSGLTSVTIGNSVSSIEGSAFWNCTGLTSVNISDIAVWCSISFFDCGSNPLFYAHNLYLNNEKIENLVIPDSVSSIRDYAFYGCSGLTSVSIGNSVTDIGDYAFYSCSGLTSVTVGNSVTDIGDYAFCGCAGLTSVNIGNSVTNIENGAFSGCTKLTKVTINSNSIMSKDYSSSSSLKRYFGDQVTKYILGENVWNIGNCAFYDCTNMKTIEISSCVTSIRKDAFYNCTALSKVNISDITSWCNISFSTSESNPLYYAHKLYLNNEIIDSLTIPDGVSSIGDRVFINCSSLSIVHIPNSVVSIGYAAFSGCNADIYVMSQNVTFPKNKIFETDNVYGFSYLNSINHNSDYWKSFTPFDVPNVKVGPAAIILKGVTLQNYDDIVISCELDDDYFNLRPNTSYNLYYTMKTAKGEQIRGFYPFKTSNLIFTSITPKVVNSAEVIVAATTNLFDETPNAGFEWRKIDAPDEIPSKSADAPVYDGMIEGILKNIDANIYYKVRPYYKSKDGYNYYGDWIGFDPLDFSYFEPTVKTYDCVEIIDGVARLVGYALKGTDEITEQGFEYWKTNDSNHLTVMASGQRMEANVQNLVGGTYIYRAYVKTSKGTYYGNEYSFEMEEGHLPEYFSSLSDDGKTLTFSCGNKPQNLTNVFDFNTADTNPAWYSQRANITKVVFDPSFAEFRPISTYGWFRGMENLEEIEGLEYLNTSETTLMSYMFYGCTKLMDIDVSCFETSKVAKMGYMFQNCASLESIDISNFDYSANTSCYRMFNGCTSLKEVNFGEWKNNTNNQYGYMFAGCSSFETLDLSQLVLPSDAKTTSMLNGCKTLRQLSISPSMSVLNSTACSGIGTADNPCELIVPDGFDFGVETSGNYFRWKGGYFKLARLWAMGDVNHDGQVTVQDVMMTVNYVIGQSPANFYVENANLDGDDYITVTDVIGIVNLLISIPVANAPALSREAMADKLLLTRTTSGYAVTLKNNEPYTALQMDIQLPDDAPLNACLTDERSDGHSIVCSDLGNGHHRIVVYSQNGRPLKGNDGILLLLQTNVKHDDRPEIYDVQMTNRLFESVTLSDIFFPTGITNVDKDGSSDAPAYHIQGTRASKNRRGIIIQEGRKRARK